VASLLILAVGSLPLAARGADSAPRKTVAPDRAGPIITADERQPGDISLNGEWDFTYTPSSAREIPELPPQSAFDAKIQVPGNWDDQLARFQKAAWWPRAVFGRAPFWDVPYLSGVGWHRTTIDAPSKWQSCAVTLTIGWAPGNTCVWLNRQLVGRYDYSMYTPFSYDLTSYLKPGQRNELIVCLDNVRGFAGGTGYGYGVHDRASGISGSVTMHVSEGPGRIADVYVTPGDDLKEVVWQADLEVPGGDRAAPDSHLLWEVNDVAETRTIARGEVPVAGFTKQHRVTWKQRIPEIQPWSDRQPNLYRTTVRWLAGNQTWDHRGQRFGLRRWSTNVRKLFLNGKPIYLRGDNLGIPCFAPHIGIPISKQYWLAYLGRAKELGFNFCNFWSWVVPPQLLEAADELGVIIQCGDSTTLGETYREQYYEAIWRPIVVWTRNHPSMCIYGFGGEHDYYEGILEQFQKQYDLIKKANAECMVMPQQAVRGVEYHLEQADKKELAQTPFPHHAERLARYTKASDIFGSHIRSAFASGLFMNNPWRRANHDWTIYQRPVIEHEIYMKSSYLNLDNARKYAGRHRPFVYSQLREQLASAGLSDKWRTYWENSGRLNAIVRKHCIEKLRKCDNSAGYEELGFMDQHEIAAKGYTYTCGMVDEFLQLKPGDTKEGVLRYCNESVLLLDFEDGDGGLNRSFWARDSLPAEIMLSLYGPNPIAKGQLSWVLREAGSGQEVWKGECEVKDIRNGYVSVLHSLKMEWPDVKKTTKVNLSATLAGSGYRLANDWDFWVFPRVEPPEVVAGADKESKKKLAGRYPKVSLLAANSKENLHIVCELTQNEVDHLAQGGDVLLLGTRPLPVHLHGGDLYPGLYPAAPGRHGLAVGAVIDTRHPVLKNLPDEGWGDWIFMPLLARAPRVYLDKSACSALDISPWNPIVEMVCEPSRADKIATILEARVGKGRLLVSTCPAELNNPSRVALMDGLLRYAVGSDFRPEMKVGPEVLTALLQGQRKPKLSVAAVPSASGVKAADGREWHNKTVTVDFKSNVFYRVNDGAWQVGVSVEISRVGIHKLRTKPAADSAKEEIREVGIDLTAPTIFIRATPAFVQSASVLHVVPEASLAIDAKDDLSGVKSFEVSLDGAEYGPYAGPFKLPAGTHSVRCRVTDWAGNREETIDGENVGGPSRNMVITVRGQRNE
jgi:hypothetical protein